MSMSIRSLEMLLYLFLRDAQNEAHDPFEFFMSWIQEDLVVITELSKV
jgi:hypothetical protein